jgi:hypothetical protein
MPQYELSIDLNALNHLGINLYSNIPAVVSEVVANSWDADADHVDIAIDAPNDIITITDDGIGMSETEINQRYLKVGYRKRDAEPVVTKKQRHVMGRKGIGKLSLFSIADTIEVQSAKIVNGVLEKNGFTMRGSAIKTKIEASGGSGNYKPEVLAQDKIIVVKGTRIQLRDLKKNAQVTATALRRRLARRFTIIDPEFDFEVSVDGKPITIDDRDYFEKIEYVWYFGAESVKYADACTKAKKKKLLGNTITVSDPVLGKDQNFKITGWIGTFDERKSIEKGNNTIVVLAWGKLVQEDLLKDLDEGGLFTKYLIGDIRADFVDLDKDPDIATSDRQRLREDDPRFVALKAFVGKVVKSDIQKNWRDWRNEGGTERALQNPAVKAWFETLGSDHRKVAKQLFGKIESMTLPDIDAKRELYKQTIMAFETLALKNSLSALAAIDEPEEMARLTTVFSDLQDLEAFHYYEIVKSRVAVLTKLDSVKDKSLEKVVQQHIFDNLWLLDPSWERASVDEAMEVTIGKAFKTVDASLTDKQKKARLDIKYRTAAGKNIVIELKKYDRIVDIDDLAKQAGKYRGALQKVLKKKYPEQPQRIEIIFLLGQEPKSDNPDKIEEQLRAVDARFMTYDDLIKMTRDSYRDYLEREKKIAKIAQLVDAI